MTKITKKHWPESLNDLHNAREKVYLIQRMSEDINDTLERLKGYIEYLQSEGEGNAFTPYDLRLHLDSKDNLSKLEEFVSCAVEELYDANHLMIRQGNDLSHHDERASEWGEWTAIVPTYMVDFLKGINLNYYGEGNLKEFRAFVQGITETCGFGYWTFGENQGYKNSNDLNTIGCECIEVTYNYPVYF